jgi:short-subunit dehydrogenase
MSSVLGGRGGRADDAPTSTPVVVTGATGNVGRRVADLLLGQGVPVRAR